MNILCLIISVVWILMMSVADGLRCSAPGLSGTVLLIATNLSVAVYFLSVKKEIVYALSFIQPVLFGFLFSQMNAVGSEQHFAGKGTAGLGDWASLTFLHLVRAMDIIDFMQEFGWNAYGLKPVSGLGMGSLVIFHLVVDFFLLGVFYDLTRGFFERRKLWLDRGTKWVILVGPLVCFALITLIGVLHDWNYAEFLLWPLDSFLRVLDIGDAFQIYGWKLHSQPFSFGLSILALSFRLIVSLMLARPVSRVLMKIGIKSRSEMLGSLKSSSPRDRLTGLQGLEKLDQVSPQIIVAVLQCLDDPDHEISSTAQELIQKKIGYRTNWEAQLFDCLLSEDLETKLRAIKAIALFRDIGSQSATVVVRFLAEPTSPKRKMVMELLLEKTSFGSLVLAINSLPEDQKRAVIEKLDLKLIIKMEGFLNDVGRILIDFTPGIRKILYSIVGTYQFELHSSVPLLHDWIGIQSLGTRKLLTKALSMLDLGGSAVSWSHNLRGVYVTDGLIPSDVVRALTKCLADQDPMVQKFAETALKRHVIAPENHSKIEESAVHQKSLETVERKDSKEHLKEFFQNRSDKG